MNILTKSRHKKLSQLSQFGGSQAKVRWSDVMGSGEGLIIFYILYFIFYILRINTFLHFVDVVCICPLNVKSSSRVFRAPSTFVPNMWD